MAEVYDVNDYGALDEAAALNNKMVTSIENFIDSFSELDLAIGDTTVFEGPISDDCYNTMKSFKATLTEAETLFRNLASTLNNTSDIYQTADKAASNALTSVSSPVEQVK